MSNLAPLNIAPSKAKTTFDRIGHALARVASGFASAALWCSAHHEVIDTVGKIAVAAGAPAPIVSGIEKGITLVGDGIGGPTIAERIAVARSTSGPTGAERMAVENADYARAHSNTSNTSR
jgi:hypothetical protein